MAPIFPCPRVRAFAQQRRAGGRLHVARAAARRCTGFRSPSPERGIEGLVRLRGRRRQQRFAGRIRAANVASGWVTPRRDAGIQARITTGRLG